MHTKKKNETPDHRRASTKRALLPPAPRLQHAGAGHYCSVNTVAVSVLLSASQNQTATVPLALTTGAS